MKVFTAQCSFTTNPTCQTCFGILKTDGCTVAQIYQTDEILNHLQYDTIMDDLILK